MWIKQHCEFKVAHQNLKMTQFCMHLTLCILASTVVLQVLENKYMYSSCNCDRWCKRKQTTSCQNCYKI